MRQVRIHSILLGLLILTLGIVWLLRNLGVVEADIGGLIATYWPALLIIWGLDAIFSAVSPHSNGGSRSQGVFSASGIFGLVLVILGVVIIGRNLGLYHVDLSIIWRVLWPIVIILIGWSLIRGSSAAGGTYWAVMSGIERKVPGWNLDFSEDFCGEKRPAGRDFAHVSQPHCLGTKSTGPRRRETPEIAGAPRGARTPDPLIKSQLLYQLS
ncbi:MAG: hypothetical protein PWR07_1956 [Bacillota bacterium]|nr:hypothetical protein [Bacillota bacterium]